MNTATTHELTGRCLCGAVTVTAGVSDPFLRACHCDMCRRQNSAMFMSLATIAGSETVTGEVASYRSSDWAERGFCPKCGSTLWYRLVEDGVRHLSAGLFDNAAGAPLKLEYFSDKCPQGYALTGDHRRLTTEETIALFAPAEGEHQ